VAVSGLATRPSQQPTREGAVFTGWYTDEGCTHRYDFSAPVTADFTLYANWGIPLATRDFWAQNMYSNQYYQIRADLLAQGQYCDVWVERDPRGLADSNAARNTANAYDGIIHPRMIEAFGVDGPFPDSSAVTIMEYADGLTDRNGKLSILLLDIKDSYNPPADNSYVGGYFWSGNFYQADPASFSRSSNEMDMIYIDAYPGQPGEADSNRTLAHELQHLINFVTSSFKRTGSNPSMDLWIDEGLSSAAEYLCLDTHSEDRYQWFNTDPKGTIARGNNFFVWGNHAGDSILDDYATVYLFFQWLRVQSGGNGIYKNILNSPNGDYQAVTAAAAAAVPGRNYNDWGTLLKTWMAANYLNAADGPYGYRDDPILKTVKARTAPAGTTAIGLSPGEGVYSKTVSAGTTGSFGAGSFVKYAGLSGPGNAGTVSDTATFAGGALLTYNTNQDTEGSAESGKLTGMADRIPAAGYLSRNAAGVSGAPVRIDARDMLARNNHPAENAPAGLFPPFANAAARSAHDKTAGD
jgi:uncharacterized repeat protein (TIGR02543 family)